MPTAAQRTAHRRWLLELTALPTAAGREDRVIEWIEGWVRRRRNLTLRRDTAGNVLITRKGRVSGRPIFITAHLDHPAFIVREVIDADTVELEFRGGVDDPYFEEARIEIVGANRDPRSGRSVPRATITRLDSAAKPFKRVIGRLDRPVRGIAPGDIARWALRGRGGRPTITNGLLYAQACDDLAGVAAAMSTLDVVRSRTGAHHVGLLLTRAEEVGLVGATAACKRRSVPVNARLICLETSRSFPESPIGAGPILRVGDRLGVFSRELTNRLGLMLGAYQAKHPRFRAQRKLMPGGVCEASTFSAYGYDSCCVCLALGNYHNMVDIDRVRAGGRPAKVGPEYISLDDYHGLIELLSFFVTRLDSARVPEIADRMEARLRAHGRLLGLR
ncbi:MAG: hypothetical protein ACYS0G_02825 [Planctomycetota bacterium]|jgi:endoglucanase